MTANTKLNQITDQEEGLTFINLLDGWHKGNHLFASDIERIVCKAMESYSKDVNSDN